MADSAMVSAYFFAQKIEDFHPRFSWGVLKHPQFSFMRFFTKIKGIATMTTPFAHYVMSTE